MNHFQTKKLVYAAAAVALAMITSMIKIFSMPMGGSVTLLSMFFIALIGYWHGPAAGIAAGAAYGFLQFAVDPFLLTIPQLFLDYPFAFGALGLSGFFRNHKYGLTLGYLAGVAGRYFFAFWSGWIFFGSYGADYHMSGPVYSLAYNGSYLGAEAAVTLILINLPPVRKALEHIKKRALS